MCGRYGLTPRSLDIVLAAFAPLTVDPAAANFVPRENMAPTEHVPAVLTRAGERRLELLQWSLVPRWAERPELSFATFNAPAETVAEKATFREPWRRGQRCLLLADRFYEWATVPATPRGRKQCYELTVEGGAPFALGGLWADWRSPSLPVTTPALGTCTIVTTTPNEVLASFHDRSPVIIPASAYDAWLDPSTSPEDLATLLAPYPAESMTATAIAGPGR